MYSDSSTSDNTKIKRNKKRRALRGKQRVELLMNSVGKRTVVLLNLSFFYFFNPFFVSGHAMTTVQTLTIDKKKTNIHE
jgi:hypothetical protein